MATWHPTANRFVFAKRKAGFWGIWEFDLETMKETNLSSGEYDQFDPCYSPDGTEPRTVTTHPSVDCEPTWYPDGSSLCLSTNRNGSFDIIRVSIGDIAPRREPTATAPASARK